MISFKQFYLLNESISKVIRNLIPVTIKQERYKSVADINDGSCFDFAHEVCQHVKGAKLHRGPSHSWVKFNGKHYDAEHPTGVSHPSKLNYYKRDWRAARRLTKKDQ